MQSYINGGKAAPSNLYRRDVSARTAGTVSASQGGYTIQDTATTAKVGDIYRAETSGNAGMVYKEYAVIAVTTNSFTIASKDVPVAGDTFYILGSVTPRVGSDGAAVISTAGLATEAKQDDQITELASLRAGKSRANAPYRNDYSSVNVTTGAYVTAIASLTNTCSEIEIFDSSGQTLKLAIGAAASEVDQVLIFPGGNGRIPLAIPAGSRISLRAVSANAAVGEICINLYS